MDLALSPLLLRELNYQDGGWLLVELYKHLASSQLGEGMGVEVVDKGKLLERSKEKPAAAEESILLAVI